MFALANAFPCPIHPRPTSSSLSQRPPRIPQSSSSLLIHSYRRHLDRLSFHCGSPPSKVLSQIQCCCNMCGCPVPAGMLLAALILPSPVLPRRPTCMLASPRYPRSCHLPSYPRSTILVLNPSLSFYLCLSPLPSSNCAPL